MTIDLDPVAEAIWRADQPEESSTIAWERCLYPKHYRRLAQAATDALKLTREPYVLQQLGVSPVTLRHFQRWVTEWKETHVEEKAQ